jgi:hypothetical protein
MADAMRVSAFAKWQEQGALKQHDGSFLQLQEMPSFAITTEAELQRHPLTVEAHPSQAAALPSYTAFADAPLVVTNDPRATGQVRLGERGLSAPGHARAQRRGPQLH